MSYNLKSKKKNSKKFLGIFFLKLFSRIFSGSSGISEGSVFSVMILKISIFLNFNIEIFRYSIVLKFKYWTFSVFNTIELPVFSVFQDPDPHPNGFRLFILCAIHCYLCPTIFGYIISVLASVTHSCIEGNFCISSSILPVRISLRFHQMHIFRTLKILAIKKPDFDATQEKFECHLRIPFESI